LLSPRQPPRSPKASAPPWKGGDADRTEILCGVYTEQSECAQNDN